MSLTAQHAAVLRVPCSGYSASIGSLVDGTPVVVITTFAPDAEAGQSFALTDPWLVRHLAQDLLAALDRIDGRPYNPNHL